MRFQGVNCVEEEGQAECKGTENNRMRKGRGRVEGCACLKGRGCILFQNEHWTCGKIRGQYKTGKLVLDMLAVFVLDLNLTKCRLCCLEATAVPTINLAFTDQKT